MLALKDGLRYLLWLRAWHRGVADGRVRPWRPRILCNRGRGRTHPQIFLLFSKIYQKRIIRVFATSSARKQMKN